MRDRVDFRHGNSRWKGECGFDGAVVRKVERQELVVGDIEILGNRIGFRRFVHPGHAVDAERAHRISSQVETDEVDEVVLREESPNRYGALFGDVSLGVLVGEHGLLAQGECAPERLEDGIVRLAADMRGEHAAAVRRPRGPHELRLDALERGSIGDVGLLGIFAKGRQQDVGIVGGEQGEGGIGLRAIDGPGALLPFGRAALLPLYDVDTVSGEVIAVAEEFTLIRFRVARVVPQVGVVDDVVGRDRRPRCVEDEEQVENAPRPLVVPGFISLLGARLPRCPCAVHRIAFLDRAEGVGTRLRSRDANALESTTSEARRRAGPA